MAPIDEYQTCPTQSFTKRKHPNDDSERKKSKHRKEGGIRWKEKKRPEESKADSQRHDRDEPDLRPQRLTADAPVPRLSLPMVAALPEYTGGTEADKDDGLDIMSKFGAAAAESVKRNPNLGPKPGGSPKEPEKESKKERKKEKKDKDRLPKSTGIEERMIEVVVNDRLGSKSRIPCKGSDKIGDFKKLVAWQIGRQPHEIMLKRQSERPFKDFLTLDDYGVSNGVQLDLELDTGD